MATAKEIATKAKLALIAHDGPGKVYFGFTAPEQPSRAEATAVLVALKGYFQYLIDGKCDGDVWEDHSATIKVTPKDKIGHEIFVDAARQLNHPALGLYSLDFENNNRILILFNVNLDKSTDTGAIAAEIVRHFQSSAIPVATTVLHDRDVVLEVSNSTGDPIRFAKARPNAADAIKQGKLALA